MTYKYIELSWQCIRKFLNRVYWIIMKTILNMIFWLNDCKLGPSEAIFMNKKLFGNITMKSRDSPWSYQKKLSQGWVEPIESLCLIESNYVRLSICRQSIKKHVWNGILGKEIFNVIRSTDNLSLFCALALS